MVAGLCEPAVSDSDDTEIMSGEVLKGAAMSIRAIAVAMSIGACAPYRPLGRIRIVPWRRGLWGGLIGPSRENGSALCR